MSMKEIKVGDVVKILTGKDKGRTGKVLKCIAKDRILVEGGNMVKKHVKPNPQKNIEGGILEKEAGIHISNVALLNETTNESGRVGIKILEDKRKVRYFKSNGEVVDV